MYTVLANPVNDATPSTRIVPSGRSRCTIYGHHAHFALWIRAHHQTLFCIMDQRASPNVILHYGSEGITKRHFALWIRAHHQTSFWVHHHHSSFQVDVPGAPFMVTMHILHYGSERITKRHFALWIRGHHQTSFCIMDQSASPNAILGAPSPFIVPSGRSRCTIYCHHAYFAFQIRAHHQMSFRVHHHLFEVHKLGVGK